MLTPQFILALSAKLVIDLFAGGGGASTGIEQAIGRHVDVAINHDADAIGMHEVNHPQTRHYREDIRRIDPLAVTRGELVGLAQGRALGDRGHYAAHAGAARTLQRPGLPPGLRDRPHSRWQAAHQDGPGAHGRQQREPAAHAPDCGRELPGGRSVADGCMTTPLPDWHAADAACQLHHANCPACIAAGKNPRLERCPAGAELWATYNQAGLPHFRWLARQAQGHKR